MAEDAEPGSDTETTESEPGRRIGDTDTDDDEPVEAGDYREKHVRIVTTDGEEHDHSSIYFKHSATEFIVSQDPEFPTEATTRYSKADVATAEITQHHSACFITTATAGDGPTLARLRRFRDDALGATPLGRLCVWLYYAVSPPIAATLRRYPRSRPTRLVRWLVHRCGSIATRRERCKTPLTRVGYSIALVGLYVVGLLLACVGHLGLRLRE